MRLTAITSIVKVIGRRGILCHTLFNFLLFVFLFFINVCLLIFYQDQVTVNQESQCCLIVRQL
jgi:hypothetical protein